MKYGLRLDPEACGRHPWVIRYAGLPVARWDTWEHARLWLLLEEARAALVAAEKKHAPWTTGRTSGD